ncbi:MAG: sugar ABC transporter permease, partial [Arthrobacter sp.]
VVGAVIGGLVMGVLNQGLSILSVDAAWQQVIKGLVLLLAVAVGFARRGRRAR